MFEVGDLVVGLSVKELKENSISSNMPTYAQEHEFAHKAFIVEKIYPSSKIGNFTVEVTRLSTGRMKKTTPVRFKKL